TAVQIEPTSGEARRKLGEAFLKADNVGRALGELVRAADYLPNDMDLQLKAGKALLAVKRFEDARGKAEIVLAKDPMNVDANILKGNALAGLQDFDAAISTLQKAIDSNPSSGVGYSFLGALQFSRGDTEAAEAAFKRAVAAEPKSTPARLALANLYWTTRRAQEAEKELREAVAIEPSNVLANRALAMMLLETKRPAEAEPFLKVVASNSKGSDAELQLADLYVALQRFDDAKAIYVRLAAGGERVTASKLRLAALGLVQGDRAGSEKLVDEILSREPDHAEALVAKARLQYDQGQIDQAIATAKKATESAPGLPMGHFLLGRLYQAKYQNVDAEEAFKAALRASPKFSPASTELARLALSGGKYAEAVSLAQAALTAAPGNGEAHLLLARAQMAVGDSVSAERSIQLMSTNFPDSPPVLSEAARLRLIRGDRAGGRQLLERALKLDPTLVSAIETVVLLDVQEGKKDAGRRRLDSAVAASPKSRELLLAAAKLYAVSFNDAAAAERMAKTVLNANGEDIEAYDTLARVYVKRGDLPAATAEFEKLVKRQPMSVANHTAVGVLHALQGNNDKAKAAYESALAIDPKAPVASNNLAQLYADQNQNLDVALTLAKTAKSTMPLSHEIDDTIGWLYYKKNMGSLAVGSLQSAVAAQPDNAVYLYHLGAAYALNKDRPNARLALEKALKIGNFAGADDAKKILDSLK